MELSRQINVALIKEAREQPAKDAMKIIVVAVVLACRDGSQRLVMPCLEHGDGEGADAAELIAMELEEDGLPGDNETLRIEFYEVDLASLRPIKQVNP